MRGVGAGRSRWREAKQRLTVDPEVACARAQRLELAIRPNFRRAVLAGAGALIAMSVVGTLGGLYARSTQSKLIAVGLAAAFVVPAVWATRSAGRTVAATESAWSNTDRD